MIRRTIMDAAAYYRHHLKELNEAISIVCRRHGMTREEGKEFAQHVHLQLIENDYGKLRAFKGASSLTTYLYTVISRIFIDQVRSKWHPSAEAVRMGAAAVALEKLVYQNQYAVHEACHILAANPVIAVPESTARAMLARMQVRRPRAQAVDDPEEHLPNCPDPAPDPEDRLARSEVRQKRQAIIAHVGEIARSLSGEDKLLVKMIFVGNRKVSEVARMLGREDRTLYKRIESILRNMRRAMADAGVSVEEVREVLSGTGDHNE